MNKTNAMRRLDTAKIKYEICEYVPDESDLSGVHVAEQIGKPPEIVFKTLAARGDKTGIVVFCIPCAKELDMKAAAAASRNKSIELLHVKDLLAATGYIRGGVSPIGMKKSYPTYIDASAQDHEEITLSAGMKGAQLLLNSAEIIKFLGATVCPITR
ncbi:MAG: Cys-tRNA(Pro) deacylase [Clostridia bacterium]|nr:Cys-tRNA(Pro) deacylase [Clostridia bacterium]